MGEIIKFLIGVLLSGIGGASVGYFIGKSQHMSIQIGGNNSKQTQIMNVMNEGHKTRWEQCVACDKSKFIESKIAMKELYCDKHECLCDQIKKCELREEYNDK